MADATRVVIVGGGFAGVACARRLVGEPGFHVTLVDQRGAHEFTPLLYQVATAELPASEVRFARHQQLDSGSHRPDRVRTHVATALAVGSASAGAPGHTVTLDDGQVLRGDVVVLAAGSQPDYADTTGAARFAYPLDSVEQAVRIRDRMRQLLAPGRRGPPPQLVVVGGGPTGVEVAGALADQLASAAEQPEPAAELTLIEQGQALLPTFSDHARQRAADRLRGRGVRVRFGAAVTEVGPDYLILSSGEVIPSELTVWAGGLAAAHLIAAAGVPTGPGGRVTVSPELTVPAYPRLYAIGDAANLPAPGTTGGWLPQLASVAAQSGQWAAGNIVAARRGQPGRSFDYRDRGILALLDRQAAVAERGERYHEVHGRLAFATWLAVHAELLPEAGARVDTWRHWADEFYLHPARRQPMVAPAEPVLS